MTWGGISKASKGVNLSEDIFAGFNWILRGGWSTQADYIQVILSPSLYLSPTPTTPRTQLEPQRQS